MTVAPGTEPDIDASPPHPTGGEHSERPSGGDRPAGPVTPVRPPRSRRVALAAVALLFIAGAVAVAVYAVSQQREGETTPTDREASSHSTDGTAANPYADAWESAMRKAGVETTMPAEPVPVTGIEARGSHAFSATFTDAEITALMNMHPFPQTQGGRRIVLGDMSVEFNGRGQARIDAQVNVDDESYRARVEGTAFMDGTAVSGIAEKVRVEGIPVPSAQREQVSSLVFQYVNAWLQASPGLRITSAEIVDGGVRATGTAPDTLEFRTSAAP